MSHFSITFDEPAWPDLDPSTDQLGRVVAGTMLVGGMTSGKSSVALRIELPAEKTAVAEMSLAQLEMFVQACRGREAYLQGLAKGDSN